MWIETSTTGIQHSETEAQARLGGWPGVSWLPLAKVRGLQFGLAHHQPCHSRLPQTTTILVNQRKAKCCLEGLCIDTVSEGLFQATEGGVNSVFSPKLPSQGAEKHTGHSLGRSYLTFEWQRPNKKPARLLKATGFWDPLRNDTILVAAPLRVVTHKERSDPLTKCGSWAAVRNVTLSSVVARPAKVFRAVTCRAVGCEIAEW